MSDASASNKVLVVTASPTLRALLELAIEEHGILGQYYDRAQDGLDFLKNFTPRAIVLDDVLEIDPFSIAARLKMSRRLREVPVILFVSESDEKAKLTAEFARVEHILTKPVDRKAFGNILNQVINQPKAKGL